MMWGRVFRSNGTTIPRNCLEFYAFVGSETLRYPGDTITGKTGYDQSTNTWFVVRNTEDNGRLFTIVFHDICTDEGGINTATIVVSGTNQNIGDTYLSYMLVADKGKPTLSVSVSPTPFNKTCKIAVTGSGYGKVEILNVLGQVAEVIYEGEISGNLNLEWSPDKFRAGIYFVKVSAKTGTAIARAVFAP